MKWSYRKQLGLQYFCRNTTGLLWLALIWDAWTGAKYHKGTDLTFWWYLKQDFTNRHPFSYRTRWWWERRVK